MGGISCIQSVSSASHPRNLGARGVELGILKDVIRPGEGRRSAQGSTDRGVASVAEPSPPCSPLPRLRSQCQNPQTSDQAHPHGLQKTRKRPWLHPALHACSENTGCRDGSNENEHMKQMTNEFCHGSNVPEQESIKSMLMLHTIHRKPKRISLLEHKETSSAPQAAH